MNEEDLSIIFHEFYEKKVKDEDIKNLVILWREKGETPHELKRLAHILNIKQGQKDIFSDTVDVCGTGGDKSNTFNVSTLAAIIASSCGAKVIKHSGRSTTSISGSVNILSQFEINTDGTGELKENCFRKTNLMFVSSNLLRETFGEVKKICKEINLPGFVNLLGPLTNPYKTTYHILGVSNLEWGKLLSSTLKLLNKNKEVLVVCSEVKKNKSIILDELSFCGSNYLWHLVNREIYEESFVPSDFGIKTVGLNELVINDIKESKDVFEKILRGELTQNDPKVGIVALNAGAVLYLTKMVKTLADGYDFALQHIQSGKSWEHLQNFINCNKKNNVY